MLGFSSAGPSHAPPIPDLRTSLITTNYFYGDLASVELGCHRRSALLLALRQTLAEMALLGCGPPGSPSQRELLGFAASQQTSLS